MEDSKIIKGMEACKQNKCDCRCPYIFVDECRNKLISDALALLKEQEAKQVTIAQAHFGTKYGLCPRCGKQIDTRVNPSFCGNCGQAVKWDD